MLQLRFGTCQKIYVEQRVHWEKFITLRHQKVAQYTNHTYLEPSYIWLKNMSSL